MVHYNYSVQGWARLNQKLLYFLFKELLLDMDLNGDSPRLGTVSDPDKPYVEIEDNERVRIRRVTHLSDEVLNDLLQRAGKIYEKVKDISKENLQDEFIDFLRRNKDRITHTNNEILAVKEQLRGTPFETYFDDGKLPIEFELDRKTGKKLERLSQHLHKPQDEVVETLIKKHLDDIGDGNICCFCNKKIVGMGNNPAPASDRGRCCDKCNQEKVIPARYANPNWREQGLSKDLTVDKNSLIEAVKQTANMKYKKRLFTIFKEGFDIEKLYEYYQIPVEDRLKNFQILHNFFKEGTKVDGRIEGVTKMQEIANSLFYSQMVLPIINSPDEKKKAYHIDDDLAEKILKRRNYPETLLPFASTIIDCALPVEDRFYLGFLCTKIYDETLSIKSATSITSCYLEKEGDEYNLAEEWFVLEKEVGEAYHIKDNKFVRKLKNFIHGVLSFIQEPDVEIFDHPLNPRNNQRRVEKGRLPLPSFVTLRITGKKRIYLERYNHLPPQPKNFLWQQDVKNTWIHFYNKKKYKKLYQLYEEDRQECLRRGYEWYPPKQVLRKRKNGFTRYKDKPRRNVSYVLEDEKYKNAVEIKKEDIQKMEEQTK